MELTGVDIHPDADRDADEAHDWYRAKSQRAADGFLEAIAGAIGRIRESPGAWPRDIGDCHRYVLRRYPYLVFYRPTLHGILIVAVAHTSRKPGYWKDRLR